MMGRADGDVTICTFFQGVRRAWSRTVSRRPARGARLLGTQTRGGKVSTCAGNSRAEPVPASARIKLPRAPDNGAEETDR